MNILITGGLGYIGSHTCVKLLEAGYHPIIIDNLYNSKKSVLQRIERITGKTPLFYYGDIRDKALLNTIFQQHTIAAVIHFAGLKAVGESVTKPLEYYENNVYGSICLAQVMQAHQVKNLIFSSSATVYGEKNPTPYLESYRTGNITNPYGWSKFMVEQSYIDLYNAQQDWSIALLRYFNPVGAHPSGLMGEDPKGIPNNLMPYLSQVAIGKRDKLSVYGNDYPTKDGTGVRDYIHVEDLALGHVAALQKMDQPSVHIYNLGSGQGSSVLEVLAAYEKACGKKLPYQIVDRRAGDIAAFWADASKAKQELNWQTECSLDDMAKDSWNWQAKNPEGYPNE
ncbi:UDP-galactose 4-epimerase [Orbus hercynius]|uniref:UDP-glucose 4-epimerase n=1 Tax=Orbus hercynius TaxID=593135 RepID=A0A495RHP4_9GAMM|nr:UDP-glucose 4-epimerase GalE [Orbus hercynius]RKS87053.1 UDP-galactose 4-epimerase [Orbus hercynius]